MATQYAFGQIVTSGLVVSLDAADKNSYPGSGTIWTDLTGNNNSGSLINGPTFNSANGGSIFTDGTDDYIVTPNAGSATDNYTFSAWFNNDNYSEEKFILTRGKDGFGAGWSLFISVSAGGTPISAAVPTVPSTVGLYNNISTKVLSLNTWYYITGVWRSGVSIGLYINGMFDCETATTRTTLRSSTRAWAFGIHPAASIFTSGYTAAAQIYNRALSADEILQDYNAQKSRFGL